jgi:hypothetical protein
LLLSNTPPTPTLMPAVMARGFPLKVPAWYMGPAQAHNHTQTVSSRCKWHWYALCLCNWLKANGILVSCACILTPSGKYWTWCREHWFEYWNRWRDTISVLTELCTTLCACTNHYAHTCWWHHAHDFLLATVCAHRQAATNDLAHTCQVWGHTKVFLGTSLHMCK